MASTPKTLLLGADGFIGRHLAFGLRTAGHEVVCAAKNPFALAGMGFATLAVDLTTPDAQTEAFWQHHVKDMDHVVNCAGLLTRSVRAFTAVHITAPKALYAAMNPQATGVLISAVGIDADTDFSKYRRSGEDAALAHNITALRCGLVLGDTAYGGSSLIRALAAMPAAVPVPAGKTPDFNPIHAADLADVVAEALTQPPKHNPIDIGGPEILNLRSMLSHYRRWLGLSDAPFLSIQPPVMALFGAVGDLFKMGPISRTSLTQINHGVLADTRAMTAAFITKPRGFSAFLNTRPAGTSDLWHARLFLAKPLVRLTLAFLWLVSGLIGLTLPPDQFLPLLDTAFSDHTLILLARAGGAIDLAIALALARNWHPFRLVVVQAVIILCYTIVFTVLNPALWLLPLGGLLKNIPILALLTLHALMIRER